jgi:hypothetical protein
MRQRYQTYGSKKMARAPGQVATLVPTASASSIRQHMSAYVSICQHTSAYVRSDAGAYGKREQRAAGQVFGHREDTEERAHAHGMDLLFKLKEQAHEAGGRVPVLLGNQEVRNLDLDFECT